MTYPPHGAQPFPSAQRTVCTWHPDRETALSCSRCGRPACPECLTPASVGFHCRQCVADSRATQRVPLTVAGARVGVQPFVTYVLIALNVLAFVAVSVQAGGTDDPSRSSLWLDYALIPGSVADGEYQRLITSGFLHSGLIHVAMNMLSLYLLGPLLERFLGRLRFTVVYLLSLLGSSVSVMLLSNPEAPTIGASGAIFGLMGALIVTFKRMRYDLRQFYGLLAVNLVLTFTISGISWQGHLGGLVVGAAVGAAMVFPDRQIRTKIQVAASVALLVVLGGVAVVRAQNIEPYTCKVLIADGIGRCGPPELLDNPAYH